MEMSSASPSAEASRTVITIDQNAGAGGSGGVHRPQDGGDRSPVGLGDVMNTIGQGITTAFSRAYKAAYVEKKTESSCMKDTRRSIRRSEFTAQRQLALLKKKVAAIEKQMDACTDRARMARLVRMKTTYESSMRDIEAELDNIGTVETMAIRDSSCRVAAGVMDGYLDYVRVRNGRTSTEAMNAKVRNARDMLNKKQATDRVERRLLDDLGKSFQNSIADRFDREYEEEEMRKEEEAEADEMEADHYQNHINREVDRRIEQAELRKQEKLSLSVAPRATVPSAKSQDTFYARINRLSTHSRSSH